MTSPQTPTGDCPVEQVELLAQGSADQPVPEELCRHLEQCADCRARLEGAAAPEIDWARVRRVLKEQPAPEEGDEGRGGLSFSLLRLLGPSDDPSVVGKIGPFEVTEVIGSGGMGMVLKARDPALDRHVAIKILAPHLASSATARRRFAREARAAAAVIHDHVIAIYQVSEHHELPYLVMPYLPDPSLQQRLDRDGKLDLESALSIGLQVAGGLEAAHAQGLIHRDVKPANVLLAKGTERAIITDFGLARAADDASLTSSGVLAGTPHYMSPEQARGEPVDFRSDLFSLGSLLFAMLAGQPPVNRELGSETIRVIGTEPMPRLRTVVADAPEWVEGLVSWLHEPRAEERPESARQVAETLEQCLKHVRNPQVEGLPERLTRAEETEMGHPKDMRLFSLIALGLFLAVFLTPPLLALTTRDEWALAFGGVAACLALFFGCLSWGERISRVVVKTLVSLVVLVGVSFLVLLGIYAGRHSATQARLAELAEQESAKAERLAAEWVKQEKGSKEGKAGPEAEGGLGVVGMPGMGGTPGGMAGPPGSGMPGMGMSGPPGMGALIGSAAASNGIFAEELKKALGEEVPVPEWKKPKNTPFPQLSGTWIATKAYLNGEEFKSQDKRQGIVLVCYGESILIRMGRKFNQPELELGSGQIRMVPGEKGKTFMVRGYSSKPDAIRYNQGPIFCTYQLDGEKLSIAFSESEPKLGPAKGQDYYEFKAFSKRFPEVLNTNMPIPGEKFFCSSEQRVIFPMLVGSWFCEKADFRRNTSLKYLKIDPKRFVLQGSGVSLVLWHEFSHSGGLLPSKPNSTDELKYLAGLEPPPKPRPNKPNSTDEPPTGPNELFPKIDWRFRSWIPGGRGPIEVEKLPSSGTAGTEFLNYEIKTGLLYLTVADTFEGLSREGENDIFVFKKIAEEPVISGIEKKLRGHLQNSGSFNPIDMPQEKPKDGGKESGKPKETPPGKVPEKAVDGKEKGM